VVFLTLEQTSAVGARVAWGVADLAVAASFDLVVSIVEASTGGAITGASISATLPRGACTAPAPQQVSFDPLPSTQTPYP